jgi:hypothetical protein
MYFDVCTVYLVQFIIQTNQSTGALVGLGNKQYMTGIVIFSTYFKIYVILIKNSSK